MANPRGQIPLKFDFLGKDNKVTQPWAFFLQTLDKALPPPGPNNVGYVIDGTAGITGPTTINQGTAAGRSALPATNDVYIAPDTGDIYTVKAGLWQKQTPALTGDVTKPAFSTVTSLATVLPTPGTFGSNLTIPVITADAKGRITSISSTTIAPTLPLLPGKFGDILFKADNTIGVDTSEFLVFDSNLGELGVLNQFVAGNISFLDANITMKNLSPLTTKGDIMGFDGNLNTRLGVGTDNYVLTADSTAPSGIAWKVGTGGTSSIEVPFNFGDASPKFLANVPMSKAVLSCSIVVLTAFNGVTANLQVGSTTTPNDIMSSSDNNALITSTWGNNPNTVYGSNTPVYLTINNGSGTTAGSGIIILNVQT